METVIHARLADIPAAAWDRLNLAGNPFLSHGFLHALEQTRCVGPGTGWQAQHIAIYGQTNGRRSLVGAVPLYLKTHSYGEYVFDWAWASAYQRAGLDYYPKLVAAVPFTPATGQRLLTSPDANRAAVSAELIAAARELARHHNASSLHWLFLPEEELVLLEDRDHLSRTGCQFHWDNPGYNSFDDFLAGFSSKKRKNVRRERRQVKAAGIRVEMIDGPDLRSGHWDRFYAYYQDTLRRHNAIPYLNHDFFRAIGQTIPEKIVMALARQGNNIVAGALYLRSHDTLYGRYWGSLANYDSLHFETCYYAAIDYCIAHGLKHFEAGAQGEHKLSRGFLPVLTYSVHWLSHPQFSRAVADFLAHEKSGMAGYMDELHGHSPFRQEARQDDKPHDQVSAFGSGHYNMNLKS